MRRLIAPAALIAALVLAGCSPAAPAQPTPLSEADYLEQARALDTFSSYTEDALTSLGEGTCSTLEEASTPEQRSEAVELVVSAAEDANGSGADMRELMALAAATYCPDLPLK